MNTEKALLTAIAEFTKVCRKIGVKKTIESLKGLTSNESLSPYEKSLQKAIITETCKEFNINRAQLMNHMITGDDLDARTICFILMDKHLQSYTHEAMSKIFNKTRTLVSKALREFNDKDVEHPVDKEFLAHFNMVDAKIIEFKTTCS